MADKFDVLPITVGGYEGMSLHQDIDDKNRPAGLRTTLDPITSNRGDLKFEARLSSGGEGAGGNAAPPAPQRMAAPTGAPPPKKPRQMTDEELKRWADELIRKTRAQSEAMSANGVAVQGALERSRMAPQPGSATAPARVPLTPYKAPQGPAKAIQMPEPPKAQAAPPSPPPPSGMARSQIAPTAVGPEAPTRAPENFLERGLKSYADWATDTKHKHDASPTNMKIQDGMKKASDSMDDWFLYGLTPKQAAGQEAHRVKTHDLQNQIDTYRFHGNLADMHDMRKKMDELGLPKAPAKMTHEMRDEVASEPKPIVPNWDAKKNKEFQ